MDIFALQEKTILTYLSTFFYIAYDYECQIYSHVSFQVVFCF